MGLAAEYVPGLTIKRLSVCMQSPKRLREKEQDCCEPTGGKIDIRGMESVRRVPLTSGNNTRAESRDVQSPGHLQTWIRSPMLGLLSHLIHATFFRRIGDDPLERVCW